MEKLVEWIPFGKQSGIATRDEDCTYVGGKRGHSPRMGDGAYAKERKDSQKDSGGGQATRPRGLSLMIWHLGIVKVRITNKASSPRRRRVWEEAGSHPHVRTDGTPDGTMRMSANTCTASVISVATPRYGVPTEGPWPF
jgi:hypothetical protein